MEHTETKTIYAHGWQETGEAKVNKTHTGWRAIKVKQTEKHQEAENTQPNN